MNWVTGSYPASTRATIVLSTVRWSLRLSMDPTWISHWRSLRPLGP